MTGVSTAPSRQLLEVTPAPVAGVMTIVSLTNILDANMALAVSYVPDQLVLTRPGFDAYTRALGSAPATTPEALAALVAADIANELVPKWLRVTVNRHANGAINHSVTVEDRQPGWDHQAFRAP
jgi:hypothetical protein